jgi:hypothetical protein
MQIDLELYVTPSGHAEDLGRFMDDFVAVAEAGSVQHDTVWSSLITLMDLRQKNPDEIRDQLVTWAIWRWFDDLPVFRTPGEPCVFFSVVQYQDEGPAEMRIHAFGAALRLSRPDEAEWEARILARCRSLGLCT